MNEQDYTGSYKWKFLIPTLYIFNWLLMALGPLYDPYRYQVFCVAVVVYSILKMFGMVVGVIGAIFGMERNLDDVGRRRQQLEVNKGMDYVQNISIYHAIIIPSYKQDQQVLTQTIDKLSQNNTSKTHFIVIMAMQAHQQNSEMKAKALISKWQNNFLYMGYTVHQIREGEFKGKASNVSWSVEHLEEVLNLGGLRIDMGDVMVTVVDADSWAPVEYFEAVQIQLLNRTDIRHRCMFSPPQIYTRNHLQTPVISRTYDSMHAIAHLTNLVGCSYFFPLSNYTISYNLIKKIGWWDTCSDAIGQDFHTCQKCYWKCENFVTVPIFVPFNQLSLCTGGGFISDIKARYEQAKRHTLGVSDVAYSWNMLMKSPFKFSNVILTLLVTQVYAVFAFMPWAFFQLGLQYKVLNIPELKIFPMWTIDVLLNIPGVLTVLAYILYIYWRRKANRRIWNMENQSLWRVIEYPIFFVVALVMLGIPSFVSSSFGVLFRKVEYRVAEKHITKRKSYGILNENYGAAQRNIQLKQINKKLNEQLIKK